MTAWFLRRGRPQRRTGLKGKFNGLGVGSGQPSLLWQSPMRPECGFVDRLSQPWVDRAIGQMLRALAMDGIQGHLGGILVIP